jgi:branched-chain amino acid transport system permease protein
MTFANVVQLIIAGLSSGSIYALVGLGLVLANKGTGILNFAQGELVTLGAYAALFFSLGMHLPYWAVLFLTLIVAGGAGALIERLLLRPLLGAPHFTVVVATLAIGLIIKNALRLAWPEAISTFESPLDGVNLQIGDININAQYMWITGCSLLIMAALALFFRSNLTGKAMQAVAQNVTAAQLMGVPVGRIFTLTFAVSTSLAALAGVLMTPVVGISAEMGNVILKGFVAAILGGFNSLLGCAVGGFALGILEIFGGVYFGGLFKDATAFALLMIILLVRPHGIFGTTEAKRV